jgi:hypothetical protein
MTKSNNKSDGQITMEMAQIKTLVEEIVKNRDIIIESIAAVKDASSIKENPVLNRSIVNLINDLTYWTPFDILSEVE